RFQPHFLFIHVDWRMTPVLKTWMGKSVSGVFCKDRNINCYSKASRKELGHSKKRNAPNWQIAAFPEIPASLPLFSHETFYSAVRQIHKNRHPATYQGRVFHWR